MNIQVNRRCHAIIDMVQTFSINDVAAYELMRASGFSDAELYSILKEKGIITFTGQTIDVDEITQVHEFSLSEE